MESKIYWNAILNSYWKLYWNPSPIVFLLEPYSNPIEILFKSDSQILFKSYSNLNPIRIYSILILLNSCWNPKQILLGSYWIPIESPIQILILLNSYWNPIELHIPQQCPDSAASRIVPGHHRSIAKQCSQCKRMFGCTTHPYWNPIQILLASSWNPIEILTHEILTPEILLGATWNLIEILLKPHSNPI